MFVVHEKGELLSITHKEMSQMEIVYQKLYMDIWKMQKKDVVASSQLTSNKKEGFIKMYTYNSILYYFGSLHSWNELFGM